MNDALVVFSDLSEKLNYNLPNFPLYVRKGTLHNFHNYAAACHWHPDIEFILVLEGSMDFFVNGEVLHIDKGNGIFVNSNRLHYGFSQNKNDCTYIVVVIHPSLLGEVASLARSYWDEKFGVHMNDFIVLKEHNAREKEVLVNLKRLYEEMHNQSNNNPLRLLSSASNLCACIGELLSKKTEHMNDVQLITTIWKMIGFIHQHYDLKISLDDIASAGNVCRSQCCKLFNKYVGQTPNIFLTQYRIQKSCDMLRETNRSVCEIAISCGFQSASYFTSIFRKQVGYVPIDYRKQNQ